MYASYKLGQMGYDVTVSSNPAAGKILDISDPEGVYVKKRVDIEKCLDEIEEGDYDLLVGCVHKDAAATFFITYYHILKCKALAIVFSSSYILYNLLPYIKMQGACYCILKGCRRSG